MYIVQPYWPGGGIKDISGLRLHNHIPTFCRMLECYNAGWVRGIKQAEGGWGAYLWVIQNRIAFQSSTSEWWTTTNGIAIAITNVMVGSLGDYGPVSDVVDIGPSIPTNYPGANYSDFGIYQVDITNVCYQLSIPDIWITPREAVACVGGSNVQYMVTGTNIANGVNWALIPDLSGSNGAVIQASNDWHFSSVTLGNVGTNYKIRATSVDNTNFYDEVNLTVVKLELTNMTFGAGWSLTQDTGGSYPTPHWTSTNSSPYLYERSTKINVSAVFKVLPANFSGSITINGDGPANLDFINKTISASGGLATYPATDSIGAFTNYVDFLNPMQINWRYVVNGTITNEAGSSSNMVYVCLADPSSVPTLYHTVVHLACSVGHATDNAGAVSNSWSQLSGHNFTTWDGRALYYYKDGAGWNSPYTISGLLSTGNGNCVAWRNLFRHALKVNGVNSDYIYVRSSTLLNYFLVGDWTFGIASFTNSPPYNWKLQFATNEVDMVPRPPGDVYGDLTSLTNIPGQNTAPPSEKVFGNHRMARYNGVYYDPSYGVTRASINSFVDAAVDGYAYYHDGDPTTNFVIRVKSVSGVYEIGEWVNHPEDETDGLP